MRAWANWLSAVVVCCFVGQLHAEYAYEISCDEIPKSEISTKLGVGDPPLENRPTIVDLAFNVTEITGIDVRNGRFQFQAYTEFYWCDPREAFDSALPGETQMFVGSQALKRQEGMWNPDLSFVNEVSGIEVRRRDYSIRHDGRIRLRGYFSANLASGFDLRRFPFDSQSLSVQVRSLTWPDDVVQLRIIPGAVGVDQDFELAEWAVAGVTAEVQTDSLGASDAHFDLIEIRTTIDRRVGYYLWKAALPLMLIVALSFTVFWIPDGLATRIRLSATVMLTIVAYQFALASDLPKIAYMTAFSAFMTLSFLIVVLSVTVNTIAFYRQKAGDESIVERSDLVCRWFIPTVYITMIALGAYIFLG